MRLNTHFSFSSFPSSRCTRQSPRVVVAHPVVRPSFGPAAATARRPALSLDCGPSRLATRVVAVERASGTDPTVNAVSSIASEISRIAPLLDQLRKARDNADKMVALKACAAVADFLEDARHDGLVKAMQELPQDQQVVLLCLPAIGQGHVLMQRDAEDKEELQSKLIRLASILWRVEVFYNGIGGIVGYHHKSLQLIQAGTNLDQGTANETQVETRHLIPKAVDLTGADGEDEARAAVAEGLRAMPSFAEVYPVGGAGDRLGLKCDITGEALPAALLRYCGRTMLEGLVRDLQAREFLYYKLTGKQLTTPVAIMTSDAKGNHSHISKLMRSTDWFGRGKEAFKLFRQPLVPVISVEDGQWLLADPMKPMLKPGGHGAIWKLMLDEGVFDWMVRDCSRKAALVRQISNPMAGTDSTLLALAGCGSSRNASFGFMSCDRHVGAAEGMNVLQERKVRVGGEWKYDYGITNIEYTEFERLGIADQPADGSTSTSAFPANTNVLYVGLPAAEAVVREAVETACSEKLMPGLIFNLKKSVSYLDPLSGVVSKVRAGRMESTMQNMADFMADRLDGPLDTESDAADSLSTFLVYNNRKKVTSSAKKKREPGAVKIAQTPDGSFLDLMRNGLQILGMCGMERLPSIGSVGEYLKRGPGFIFLFHPSLGPLWSVISQKIRGGSFSQGSEMVLEVSELLMRDVHVDGSLLITAENIMGSVSPISPSTSWSTDGDGDSSLPTLSAQGRSEPITRRHGLDSTDMEVDTDDSNSTFSSMASADFSLFSERSLEEEDGQQRLRYCSAACGRVKLINVRVKNKGVNWEAADNVYWKHKVSRHESLNITLLGRSEFEACNVTLSGDISFEVPDGCRMLVSQDASGNIQSTQLPLSSEEPSWEWRYSMAADGNIILDC